MIVLDGEARGFTLPLGRACVARITRRACRRAFAALLSVGFLAVVAATSPHLVHHAFDPDEGADCAFLDVAHHAPAATAAHVVVLQLLLALEPLPVPRVPVCPLLRTARPLTRSPPAVTLAAA